MFEVGDYVVYGTNGVCRIKAVGPIDFSGNSREQIYYTMIPCYVRDREVFTPVDNESVVIRKVMSEKEALDFIDDMQTIEKMPVEDEKKRELAYKQALLSCEPAKIVSLIKTIDDRMQKRKAEGKKMTSLDSRFSHIAEDSLYGELAISLGMDKDAVGPYIEDKIHPLQAV
ncbi:MAG: CarD family transcriptional regulator [Eubacterium sp.]|nr:CarD family transcriptional regulator [Eubacterium sp.]